MKAFVKELDLENIFARAREGPFIAGLRQLAKDVVNASKESGTYNASKDCGRPVPAITTSHCVPSRVSILLFVVSVREV